MEQYLTGKNEQEETSSLLQGLDVCFFPLLVFLLAECTRLEHIPQALSRGNGSCGMEPYQLGLESGFV